MFVIGLVLFLDLDLISLIVALQKDSGNNDYEVGYHKVIEKAFDQRVVTVHRNQFSNQCNQN